VRLAIGDVDVLVDVPSHRAALEPGARARLTVVTDQALVAAAGEAPVGAVVAAAEVDAIVM
jgi:hypothetical protein